MNKNVDKKPIQLSITNRLEFILRSLDEKLFKEALISVDYVAIDFGRDKYYMIPIEKYTKDPYRLN